MTPTYKCLGVLNNENNNDNEDNDNVKSNVQFVLDSPRKYMFYFKDYLIFT